MEVFQNKIQVFFEAIKSLGGGGGGKVQGRVTFFHK